TAIFLGNNSTLSAVDLSTHGGAIVDVPGGNGATLDAGKGTFAVGGEIRIEDNAALGLRGAFVNTGSFVLASNGSNTSIFIDSPTVTFSGGGTIAMDDRAPNRILGASPGNKLVNVDNIITGSGQIGAGGSLTVDNQQTGTILATGNAGIGIALGGAVL